MGRYDFMFERLKGIREDKDLTQPDIAEILKTSKSMISKWENNSRFITLKKLNEFCNYFEVSMDYVTGLSNINDFKKKTAIDTKVIANNLRLLREKNNLSQLDLAKKINTSQSALCNYENEKFLIPTPFLYQIALELNTSMDLICGKK